MILVTLGTQDKSFERLLKKIDKEIENKKLNEKVIVQAGYTKYDSKNMEIFDYLPKEKLENLIESCDLLITHSGVGTILEGLEKNKKIIVVPRLSKYKEHNNDHQIEIAQEFSKDGYVIYVENLDNLLDYIKEAKKFEPRKLVHNPKIIETIEEFIDNL